MKAYSDEILTGMKQADFQSLLLKNGKSSKDDSCVEVHIWGPISNKTIGQVITKKIKKKKTRILIKAATEKFRKLGVAVIVL